MKAKVCGELAWRTHVSLVFIWHWVEGAKVKVRCWDIQASLRAALEIESIIDAARSSEGIKMCGVILAVERIGENRFEIEKF